MQNDAIIECVPNFSEGLDAAKVRSIIGAMEVEGVRLLDWSLDRAHNRSVVTIAGAPDAVVEAAVRSVGRAAELIDLTRQAGVHPRIGAADVVPFVPVSGVSVAGCAMLARKAGLEVWRRYGVPVYFYGAAAARPDRVELEEVRRGQFEGLREAVMKDRTRRPDVGGPELHATAGASVIGARSFLVAYNVYLTSQMAAVEGEEVVSPESEITAARAIAREIRASNGGLYGVKAIGVIANGHAQVSMNITDYHRTPMNRVFARVVELAEQHGVGVSGGELIGLIPEAAYEPNSDWVRQTVGLDAELKVLERRLRAPMAWPR